MTIDALVTAIQTEVDKTDYAFFCGLRSAYNREKKIEDVIILVPPKEWPLNWREDCSYDVEVEFWIGKLVSLRPEREDTYPLAEIRDELNTDARTLIDYLNESTQIQVVPTDISASYWSPDEGATVNSQEFVSFTLTLRVWKS